ncbi:MAG: carboxypeptidase-like regulatory domain-containing protein, partial [Vicinamibacterales bacterium]
MALRALGFALFSAFLVTATAFAQTTAGIAGTARDTTGAVLPGVTVEVARPALIEKIRTAVTDGQGRFNVTDLRPGIYSVTFTLVGFSTFKREGIEISAGFTGTANAEMKVGGLEETVTVSGASPVVDIQNVRTQQVLRAEVLEALPSGLKDVTALVSLTLGATN